MEKIIKENFKRGQLDCYSLSMAFSNKTNSMTTTPTSPPLTSLNSSSRSASTRRNPTRRERDSSYFYVSYVKCRLEQYQGLGAAHTQKLQMDIPQSTQPMYLFNEVVGNNIGSSGCNYISQANMAGLTELNLSAFIETQTTTKSRT